MPAAELTIPELFVEQLYNVPGVRMFARRADALWRSTQILDRAWDRAVETVRASGQSLREMFPDWEATAVRWSAFVDDTRDFIRDALQWFRAYAQGAIEHINSLIRELALISKRLSPTPSLSHIALIEEELARARGEHARVWRDVEFHNALDEDKRRNGRNERLWLGLLTATGLGVAVLAVTSNRSRL